MDSDLPSITILPPEEEPGYVEETTRSLNTLWPTELYAPQMSSHTLPEADKFPFQQAPASGQMSPLHIGLGLKDAAAGELFFSLENQSQLQSPSDWSPISSASGELFPETCSEGWSSAPPSHPSSPLLSPLNTDFGRFDIRDDTDFYLAPAPQRPRSSSFTEGRPSPSNTFTDSRPRSASFNNIAPPRLDTSPNLIPVEPQPSPTFGYQSYDGNFGENDTLLSTVTPPVQQDESQLCQVTGLQLSTYPFNEPMPPSSTHRRSSSLGGEVSPTYLAPPTNQQHGPFLTVPGLQRRNASHRRNHTHIGINPGIGRGRSLEPRGTTSREQSLGHTSIQVDTSFGLFSTPPTSSPNSPMSSASSNYSCSPVSPASTSSVYSYDNSPISIPDNIFSSDDPGLGRRRSLSASSVSDNEDYRNDELHRSRSDPYPTHRMPRISRRGALTSQSAVFRAEGMDNSFIDPEAVGGSQSELNLHSPGTASSTEGEFKRTVASHKIVSASEKRRKHAARFECPICEQKFTARHNLNNHLNSHKGHKAYSCQYCGQKATTQAVCTRHEMYACKKNPQKKKK